MSEPEPDDLSRAEGRPGPFGLVSSRRLMHVALTLIVVVPATIWLCRPQAPSDDPGLGNQEVGEVAPAFSLELFDGGDFDLSTHLADDQRPVVLNLWASWCIPCREEMPDIDAVAQHRPEVLFVGVAVQDSETAARAFADEVDVGYPLGHDSDGMVLEEYPILGLPATFFITADGLIAEQFFGQLDETTLEELIVENLRP